ncbi:eIF-2-alpha kinase activator GCN1 [Orobanche hederae]
MENLHSVADSISTGSTKPRIRILKHEIPEILTRSGDDAKVQAVVEKLLDVLNTPSEDLQRAVSSCLSPLMKSKQEDATALVSRLLDKLMKSEKYGEGCGAAFGLAGVVKGLRIRSLKNCGIATVIREGLSDRNSAKSREGDLLAFECLCEKLGRLFEPYVIQMLPLLLVGLSDPVMAVRDAAECAARAMMSCLSAQGVKLVLPSLLKGLEDKAWRTKQSSVLLSCCPSVGNVIKNQDIASLVPTLLMGLTDPNDHTRYSVDILLQAKPSAISAHTSTFGPLLTECLKDGIPPVTFQLTNGTENVQAAHRTVRSSFTSIVGIGTKDVIYIGTEGRSCIDSDIVRVGTNINSEDDSKLYPIIDGGMIGGSGPKKTTEILVKTIKFSDSKGEHKFLNGMTQFHTSLLKERISKGVCDPVSLCSLGHFGYTESGNVSFIEVAKKNKEKPFEMKGEKRGRFDDIFCMFVGGGSDLMRRFLNSTPSLFLDETMSLKDIVSIIVCYACLIDTESGGFLEICKIKPGEEPAFLDERSHCCSILGKFPCFFIDTFRCSFLIYQTGILPKWLDEPSLREEWAKSMAGLTSVKILCQDAGKMLIVRIFTFKDLTSRQTAFAELKRKGANSIVHPSISRRAITVEFRLSKEYISAKSACTLYDVEKTMLIELGRLMEDSRRDRIKQREKGAGGSVSRCAEFLAMKRKKMMILLMFLVISCWDFYCAAEWQFNRKHVRDILETNYAWTFSLDRLFWSGQTK